MENLTVAPETRAIVSRMEHVHVSVADAARSIDFYRRVFGFEVRYDEVGPYGRCVHVGTDRFYIALSECPGIAPAGEREGASIHHLGFTTDDLERFRSRLDEMGVAVADEARRKEGDAIYLNDPDGHEIEVVGYRKGYAYA